MKRWLKIGAIALVMVLIVGTIAPVFAITRDELEEELARLRQEKEANDKDIKETSSELETLGRDLEDLNDLLGQARYKLDALNHQINKQQVLITQQVTDIENKQQEIIETEEYLEEQIGYLEQRMRSMYKNGTVSYMEVLFAATSFTDFLSRLKFLGTIIDSDSTLINNVRDTRDWLAEEKVKLEAELVLLVERRAQLEADLATAKEEEERVAGLVVIREEMTAELQIKLASLEEAKGGLQEEEELVQQELAELIANEEWQAGKAPSFLIWPVPASRFVSSPFGWRTIFGRPNWHRGIDIAPSHRFWPASPLYEGTPAYIVAAASGTVVRSVYNYSYGWYVMIAHGGGYFTLYAHQHRRPLVNEGDTVVLGQRIGIVGSTGQSTGPHLHFEVRINDKLVNPLNQDYR